MNELISVIVPIYNVEKYLKRCVKSISNQTYKNIEIILINDGSTDSSSQLCDHFQKNDNRITVIHKKNEGLSSARNEGISISKGNYICFIDSDDYILPNYIELLYNAIISTNSDIAICSFFRTSSKNMYIPDQESIKVNIFDNEKALQYMLSKKHNVSFTISCNKLYKIDLFKKNKILFPKSKLHEDEFTTYKCFIAANKIVYINQKLYGYYYNPISITSTFNVKRIVYLEALRNRYNDLKLLGNQNLTKTSHEEYILGMLKCYYQLKENKILYYQKQIYKEYRRESKRYLLSKYKNKNKKIIILLLFPKLYYLKLKKLNLLK